jgi:DNA-binding response OmpR family regulator
MSKHILIAEDEAPLRQGLIDLLEGEGYRVTAVADGAAALVRFGAERPDLVLLDVMMPEQSGYDVCRAIRKTDSLTPILMLTAKGEEIDKVIGLELGADDYVTKPFGLHELRARVAALLRRAGQSLPANATALPDRFQIGTAVIDRKCYRVEHAGATADLTPREVKLLEIFYQRQGEVLSRNDLLNAVWGIDYFGTTRTLDQHIAQLRKKIEPNPATPQVITTIHGVGYRYEG